MTLITLHILTLWGLPIEELSFHSATELISGSLEELAFHLLPLLVLTFLLNRFERRYPGPSKTGKGGRRTSRALILIGQPLFIWGAIAVAGAHLTHPVKIDGSVQQVEYTDVKKSVHLANDNTEYDLAVADFRPALPSGYYEGAQWTLWVDQGTSHVIAVTERNAANQVIGTYTTQAFDHPEETLLSDQASGGVGIFLGSFVLNLGFYVPLYEIAQKRKHQLTFTPLSLGAEETARIDGEIDDVTRLSSNTSTGSTVLPSLTARLVSLVFALLFMIAGELFYGASFVAVDPSSSSPSLLHLTQAMPFVFLFLTVVSLVIGFIPRWGIQRDQEGISQYRLSMLRWKVRWSDIVRPTVEAVPHAYVPTSIVRFLPTSPNVPSEVSRIRMNGVTYGLSSPALATLLERWNPQQPLH